MVSSSLWVNVANSSKNRERRPILVALDNFCKAVTAQNNVTCICYRSQLCSKMGLFFTAELWILLFANFYQMYKQHYRRVGNYVMSMYEWKCPSTGSLNLSLLVRRRCVILMTENYRLEYILGKPN
jgi:hypothetical protein